MKLELCRLGQSVKNQSVLHGTAIATIALLCSVSVLLCRPLIFFCFRAFLEHLKEAVPCAMSWELPGTQCPRITRSLQIRSFMWSILIIFRHIKFRKGIVWLSRWTGLEILIPKHLWKSKIGPLEQIWAENPYVTFFWDTACIAPIHVWFPDLR